MTARQACEELVVECHVPYGDVVILVRNGRAGDVVSSRRLKIEELNQPRRAPDFANPRMLDLAQVVVASNEGMGYGDIVINVHQGKITDVRVNHWRSPPGRLHTSK